MPVSLKIFGTITNAIDINVAEKQNQKEATMHHHKMGSCCSTGHHHHRGGHKQGCCCSGDGWRKFKTKAEKVKELENYKSELEAELEAVNEMLKHFC